MILQERIDELGSGILTINNSKVELIGFTCEERLEDYYLHGLSCFFSNGLYNLEPLSFANIQDNALFIVIDKDNNKQFKYQFKLIKQDTINFKIKDDQINKLKNSSRTYKIRKCNYTDKYNYKDLDTSLLFDTKDKLMDYFKNRFHTELKL